MSADSLLARHYYLQRNMDEALEYVQATLKVHKISPNSYPRIEAVQYGTWSMIAMSLNQPELAREKGSKALRIHIGLYEADKTITSQLVASYTELGRIMILNGEIAEVERLIKESEHLRRQMRKFTRLQLFTPLLHFIHSNDKVRMESGREASG